MGRRSPALDLVIGLAGGVLGGAIGFVLVGWIARQGFYAMLLPGGLLGLGAALASRDRSTVRGAICGVAGLVLGALAEWWNFPFLADGSLSYFLTHLGSLTPLTMIMIVGGAVLAYWLGSDASFRGLTRVDGR